MALGDVVIYTMLVGADAAVVRAAIMGGLFIFATHSLSRSTFAAAGLFTAALVMTLANPNILWDVGFQISFAPTLGLMLYVEPRYRPIRHLPKSTSNLSRLEPMSANTD